MAEVVNNIAVIKKYFEKDGGKQVTMTELKDLSMDERKELGALCAKELGLEITAK